MQGGPRLTWAEVTGSRKCDSEAACAVFKDRHPSTVAMTVLVVVEMFNALNALSENNSLLQVWLSRRLLTASVWTLNAPQAAPSPQLCLLSGNELLPRKPDAAHWGEALLCRG